MTITLLLTRVLPSLYPAGSSVSIIMSERNGIYQKMVFNIKLFIKTHEKQIDFKGILGDITHCHKKN
jgi:hypothetical protein